jgi:GNAT superfamily N-acetyltransferase
MEPYYKWDPEKEEFVASYEEHRRKPISVAFRMATERDRTAILDFEAEYERSEPQSFLKATGFHDFQTGMWSADLGADAQAAVMVAFVESKIVGELSMSCYDDTHEGLKVGVIRGLCVLKPYRQAGIGRGLFRMGEEQFKRWGAERVELMYGLRNLADQQFCRKLGFEITQAGRAVYKLT